MLVVMSPHPAGLPDPSLAAAEGLGARTWSQDGLVGLELESEPTEASAPVAAPLWEACMPTPEQEGSPPRSRARSVRFAVDENTPQPLFSSDSPRPVRRLTSAERLDLTQQRPDLDVRGLPWARRIRRRNGFEDRFEDEPETVVGRSWGLFRRALRDVVDDFREAVSDAVATDAVAAEEVVVEEEEDADGLWATSHDVSDI